MIQGTRPDRRGIRDAQHLRFANWRLGLGTDLRRLRAGTDGRLADRTQLMLRRRTALKWRASNEVQRARNVWISEPRAV